MAGLTHLIVEYLQDLEWDSRNWPVRVFLHDEIATAEELESLIKRVVIHKNTEE